MTRTTPSTPHGRRALVAACTLALVVLLAQRAEARFGDFDPSFNNLGSAIPDVGAIGPGGSRLDAVTARLDGRPVAAGWAANAGGLAEAVVVQLTTSGAADPGFGSSGFTRLTSTDVATRLHGVALDASGRVLVAGDQRIATPPATPIARRFSAAGQLEPAASFAGAIGTMPGEAHAIRPLDDGTTLVAGWRVPVQGGPEGFFVARLTAAGVLDEGFGGDGIAELGLDATAHTEAMAVDAAGRIVLAGWSAVVGVPAAETRPVLARFHANGAPDESFGAGGVLVLPDAGELRAVQVDGVGRIVAAGVSGGTAFVTRRLASGEPDTTFGTGGSTHGVVGELNGLTLDGERSFVAGVAPSGVGTAGLLLGALDPAGVPDAGFGGAPPGWRTTAVAGLQAEAFAIAPGPAGTLYAAGGILEPGRPFIVRTLPNAAPAAVLAAPAQVAVGAAVTFDAGGSSDPEGEALRYAFDLDGNGTFEHDAGTSPLATRSFAAPGTYAVGVQVTDPRGASAGATRAIAVAPPAPKPLLGRQGVARPVRGIVRFRLPGTRRFVRLTDLAAIPNGTEIDVRKGRVLLTVLHDASGRLDTARFYAGRFVFNQAKGRTPITTLKLSGGSFAACRARTAARASAAAAARKKKRVRNLWGDGKGRFRTRGKYGAATVRGTKWLTQDRCDGTLVRVVRGKVSVAGIGRSGARPRLVTAGERRLVRAKGGG